MSSDTLLLKIREDMKECMRRRDTLRLGTIRMLLAAVKQREIDEKIVLDDSQVIAIVDKMIRQRRDSAEQYGRAQRQDLVAQEEAEIAVLVDFMPQPLTELELREIIEKVIVNVGAHSLKDMSQVMNEIRSKVQGRADMAKVGMEVKKILEK